jgi:hypothetical protein
MQIAFHYLQALVNISVKKPGNKANFSKVYPTRLDDHLNATILQASRTCFLAEFQ